MTDLYERLIELSGQDCYSVSRDITVRMMADASGVTIRYQSGGELRIPR